ncbi:MAG TPA: RNA polymerase sigma factor [Solirubrobacteraceae bacterium]|nr:RNA polymerase sigma factor [Solirubrobacteraceae bacterium]
MRRSSRSDQELLDATAAGDANAFGEFFLRHTDAVVAFLRRRLARSDHAAELAAETFAAALLSVHRGNATSVENGAAWVTGIARNKLIDSYRSARVANGARAKLGSARLAVDDEELERIDRLADGGLPASQALERLTGDEREAIVQRIVHEHDYEQIAFDAGESETTVRKRVSRGLTRLREQMGAQP